MANLKASSFYSWSDPSHKLILSEYSSEWLHFCGFWDWINDETGTLFQQFESNALTLDSMDCFISKIMNLKSDMCNRKNDSFCFRCRWDSVGNEIYIKISKDHMLDELEKLRDFIQQSHEQNIEIECDL